MSNILILNGSPMALDFYNILPKYLGWKVLGTVLGAGKEDEARKLGEIIK